MKPPRASTGHRVNARSSSSARNNAPIEVIKVESESESDWIERIAGNVCTKDEDDYCACADCIGLVGFENERIDEEGVIIKSEVENEEEPEPETEPEPNPDPELHLPSTSKQVPVHPDPEANNETAQKSIEQIAENVCIKEEDVDCDCAECLGLVEFANNERSDEEGVIIKSEEESEPEPEPEPNPDPEPRLPSTPEQVPDHPDPKPHLPSTSKQVSVHSDPEANNETAQKSIEQIAENVCTRDEDDNCACAECIGLEEELEPEPEPEPNPDPEPHLPSTSKQVPVHPDPEANNETAQKSIEQIAGNVCIKEEDIDCDCAECLGLVEFAINERSDEEGVIIKSEEESEPEPEPEPNPDPEPRLPSTPEQVSDHPDPELHLPSTSKQVRVHPDPEANNETAQKSIEQIAENVCIKEEDVDCDCAECLGLVEFAINERSDEEGVIIKSEVEDEEEPEPEPEPEPNPDPEPRLPSTPEQVSDHPDPELHLPSTSKQVRVHPDPEANNETAQKSIEQIAENVCIKEEDVDCACAECIGLEEESEPEPEPEPNPDPELHLPSTSKQVPVHPDPEANNETAQKSIEQIAGNVCTRDEDDNCACAECIGLEEESEPEPEPEPNPDPELHLPSTSKQVPVHPVPEKNNETAQESIEQIAGYVDIKEEDDDCECAECLGLVEFENNERSDEEGVIIKSEVEDEEEPEPEPEPEPNPDPEPRLPSTPEQVPDPEENNETAQESIEQIAENVCTRDEEREIIDSEDEDEEESEPEPEPEPNPDPEPHLPSTPKQVPDPENHSDPEKNNETVQESIVQIARNVCTRDEDDDCECAKCLGLEKEPEPEPNPNSEPHLSSTPEQVPDPEENNETAQESIEQIAGNVCTRDEEEEIVDFEVEDEEEFEPNPDPEPHLPSTPKQVPDSEDHSDPDESIETAQESIEQIAGNVCTRDEEREIVDSEVEDEEEFEPEPEPEPNPDPEPHLPSTPKQVPDPEESTETAQESIPSTEPSTSKQLRRSTRRVNLDTSQTQLNELIGCLTPRASAKRITYREPDTEDDSDVEEMPKRRRIVKSPKASGSRVSGTPEPRASTSQDIDYEPPTRTLRKRSRATSRASQTHEPRASPSQDPPPTPLSNPKPNILPCPQCSEQFNLNADLLRHLQLHAPKKRFQCEECYKSFDRKETLQRHTIIIHHPDKMPYKCEYCGQRFMMRTKCAEHKRLHTGEGLVKCAECDKVFTSQDKLDRHQFVHNGKRPWPCETCGKAFQFQNHLKKHMITHTGNLPFKCPKCPLAFAFKSRLQKHLISTHPDDNAEEFPCPMCKHVFYIEEYLKQHLKRVCLKDGRKNQYYGRILTHRKVALDETEAEVSTEQVPKVKQSKRAAKTTPKQKKNSTNSSQNAGTSSQSQTNECRIQNKAHPYHRTLGSSSRFSQTLPQVPPGTPRTMNRIHTPREKRDPNHKIPCRYPYCPRQFKNLYDMKVHYRSVHFGFKPFFCKYPECNHSAKNRSHLISHIRTRHLKLPNTRPKDAAEMLRVQVYIGIDEEQLLLET